MQIILWLHITKSLYILVHSIVHTIHMNSSNSHSCFSLLANFSLSSSWFLETEETILVTLDTQSLAPKYNTWFYLHRFQWEKIYSLPLFMLKLMSSSMDLKILLDFFLILPINVLSFLWIWYFKESSSSLTSSRSRDQHFLQTISFFVTLLFSIDSHSIVSLKNSVKYGIGVYFDILYLLMLHSGNLADN